MDTADTSVQGKTGSASSSNRSAGLPANGGHQRSSSQSSSHRTGHIATHRQSFADNQRHPAPPSPRSQRHPSLSQQAIQDLVNSPHSRHSNPRFTGRDWRDVSISELAHQEDVHWANLDTTVEEATKVCNNMDSTAVAALANRISTNARPFCKVHRATASSSARTHPPIQRCRHLTTVTSMPICS